MAGPSEGSRGKHRIHIKVTNLETGEEHTTADLIVPVGWCSFCSCCSSTILVGPHPPVVSTETRQ